MRIFLVVITTLFCLITLAPPAAAQEATIEEIQAAIEAKGADWIAGPNEAWERHFRDGWYPANLEWPLLTGRETVFHPLRNKDLPRHLDWRDMDGKNYVSDVRNQRSCGSCWAFATTGPIESHIRIQENWPEMDINLSEQFLVSCCNLVGCNACNGGFTTSSFEFAKDTGLVDEDCLEYALGGQDSVPCNDKCADWEDRLFFIDSWDLIGEGVIGPVLPDPEEIMEALQVGPVGSGLLIYDDFFSYEGGLYETVLSIPQGAHAVTVVGYDADGEYWIIKNSWGGSWGEDGFAKMKWGAAFIGAFTILPHYTAQGLKPPVDDDDDDATPADDDDDDNDTGSPTDDDDATVPTDDDSGDDDDDDNDSGGC